MMLTASFVTPDQHRAYFQHAYYYPQFRSPAMSVQQHPHLLQSSFPSHSGPTASTSHVHPNPMSNGHRLQISNHHELNQYVDSQNHSVDGFPTQQQFEDLLNDYILSLSPKKRDKALIPRKRYENILAVLKDPKCTTIESAQFRFWAKKMFRLGFDEDNLRIVCHEGKPVAVREQLYEVLTTSHGRAQHGGRDKTSAEVRRFYSWVPKELIARFVRHCPSCTMRRNSTLEYPLITTPPSPPKSSQGYDVVVRNPTYTTSNGAPSLGPMRTSNDAISSMNGNTLTMSSPAIPQLPGIPNGSQLLPPTSQDVAVSPYPYSVGFPTTLAEGTNSLTVVSSLLDPRPVYASRT